MKPKDFEVSHECIKEMSNKEIKEEIKKYENAAESISNEDLIYCGQLLEALEMRKSIVMDSN